MPAVHPSCVLPACRLCGSVTFRLTSALTAQETNHLSSLSAKLTGNAGMMTAIPTIIESIVAGVVLLGIDTMRRWVRKVDHRLGRIERYLDINGRE